ncbi:MAG: hypothetical protein U0K95_06485 [Eubacterium sp.]|nr:hypothetical protein [Eubacterium sp.]
MKKKNYVKPQILITSFELAESIASGCEQISNTAEYVCSVSDEEAGLTYIAEGISGCVYTPPNPDDFVCYHAPSDSNNVFSS